MTLAQQIVFGIACLLIGLSKGGLGGPFPIALVIPLLSLVMDPREAVPLVAPFLIFADGFAVKAYWREWDIDEVRLLLPMAVVGVILGALGLKVISAELLKLVIGVATVILIMYKLASDRIQNIDYQSQTWHGYLAGLASGFASTLANAGSFPFTIYMFLQDKLSAVKFIGTTTLFFATVNLLKLPIFYQQGLFDFQLIWSVIWALPIIVIGVWLGRKSVDYVSQVVFERILMTLLITAILLLFGSLL
jgi:hypothetical protein